MPPCARMNSAISATPLLSFRLVKMKGRVPRIAAAVAVHHRKVGADQRRQVDLVDHQQVGLRVMPGPPLRGILSPAETSMT